MTDGPHITGNNKLEIGWTAVPLVVVIVVVVNRHEIPERYPAGRSPGDGCEGDRASMGLGFEYPAYGITSDTLTLPINKQVLLELTSTDVIHGFWVPEFRPQSRCGARDHP